MTDSQALKLYGVEREKSYQDSKSMLGFEVEGKEKKNTKAEWRLEAAVAGVGGGVGRSSRAAAATGGA